MISDIVANLLFGVIGFYAFMYGRKHQKYAQMIIGGVLMAFPYFVEGALWLWGIGCGLTIALFVFRDSF